MLEKYACKTDNRGLFVKCTISLRLLPSVFVQVLLVRVVEVIDPSVRSDL